MTPKEQHDALSLFVTGCHDVLEANMHKGGWERDSPASLLRHLREEISEVEQELVKYGREDFNLRRLERECADVVNMVMMVYDRTRRMLDEAKEDGVRPSVDDLWSDRQQLVAAQGRVARDVPPAGPS